MKKFVMMVAAVLVVAVVVEGSEGFSLCNMSEDDLMTCKPAVSKPSPVDPSPECCKALSGADLTCLCSYKNSETLRFLGLILILPWLFPPSATSPLLLAAKLFVIIVNA
ncbi:putative lipid-transfer protein DIR1 [Vitis vinifera]|uniref:Putative lipid-transfer protein DIR1 n=1 Tax=Vitis vinifera TaxID=29760 RepID=A0A438DFT8_VITVI|nr:putative lipid-transfer protein DIR1 [Vitis vinifera]